MSLASGSDLQESDLRCPMCASRLGRDILAMDELELTETRVRYTTREDKLWRQTFRQVATKVYAGCEYGSWLPRLKARDLAAVVMIVSATPPWT